MSQNTSTFSTFLDEKYIPLAGKIKLIITLALIILPVAIFFFAYYQPKNNDIALLSNKKSDLEKQLRDVRTRANNLEQFEKELAIAEEKFLEASVLLPRQKEIPKLLKDISALGRNAGLDFLTFKPQADVPQDFYAEIPITINVRGPYHNMGFFFDQVSKLERIVTVSNVKMGGPKKEDSELLLDSNCRLVTYRFTNVELPKKQEK